MKSKYNKEEKSDCIYFGCVDYTKSKLKEIKDSKDLLHQAQWIGYLRREKMTDCALRLIRSENDKYKRLNRKIDKIVRSGCAVFITLTFTDEVLSNTSQMTRRRYVARYLKECTPFYVANVDFSPKTDREHYHAVVDKRIDMSKWQYGHVLAEKVRCHENDKNRVARYVAKLTNHALKVKVESRLIYSRYVI